MFNFLSITEHVNYIQLLAPKGENHSYPQYGQLKHTNYFIKTRAFVISSQTDPSRHGFMILL